MFAAIETNGATHIIIHIPHEGSDKSLPALARMLESNATFVQSSYSGFTLAKPSMSIVLGDSYQVDRSDEVLAIAQSDAVLSDTFVNATPLVLVDNSEGRRKANEEANRLRTEISFLKQQIDGFKSQVEYLGDALRGIAESYPTGSEGGVLSDMAREALRRVSGQ